MPIERKEVDELFDLGYQPPIPEPKEENPFREDDWVVMTGSEHTIKAFGGMKGNLERFIGKVHQVEIRNGWSGGLSFKKDRTGYTIHWKDCRFATDAEIAKYQADNKCMQPPSWVKAFDKNVMRRNGSYHINYFIYRAKPGDVKKPPTWAAIEKRYAKQYKYVEKDSPWGMHREEVRDMSVPYSVWKNSNTYCFARLRDLPCALHAEDQFNGKLPGWFICKMNMHPLQDQLGDLHDYEIRRWIELLIEHKCAPPDVTVDEWFNKGYFRFRLADYGIKYLYFMLVCLRAVHEQQHIVRHTLHLMNCGLNFWLALTVSHYGEYQSCCNHSMMSSSDMTLENPEELMSRAVQLKNFVLTACPKQASMLTLRSGQSFGLQDSIKRTACKIIKETKTWDDLFKFHKHNLIPERVKE